MSFTTAVGLFSYDENLGLAFLTLTVNNTFKVKSSCTAFACGATCGNPKWWHVRKKAMYPKHHVKLAIWQML